MTPLRLAAYAAAVLSLTATGARAQNADRVWTGGAVLTMNDAAMRAEAVAEKDGRILAVGAAVLVYTLQSLVRRPYAASAAE